jgi:gamma-glutamyltranspeptidase/glutathione hydrolase
MTRDALVWPVLAWLCVFQVGLEAAQASGQQGAVATGHPLATETALEAMRSGGNAIDGAIAAALTLGVVDGHNSGLGGGCLMLIRLPDGSVAAIDGRETAPAAATRDMFVREGKPAPALSQTGVLAVAVPGALAAYDYAARHYGKIPLRTHLTVAAQLARNGFNLTRTYARRLAETAEELGRFEASRSIFLKPDGTPYREGDVLTQPDLARTYQAIAEGGKEWFYRGPFAAITGGWMKTHDGLVTAGDFEIYQLKLREPIRTTYRGHEIVGFPPPSSGGVHISQVLSMLEPFDLKSMGAGSADFIHVVTEALKLAFADRAYWLGDPDFASVPRGLVSKEYAAKLAKRIDLKRASPVPQHDVPDRAGEDVFGKHTTHFSVADAAGTWVACTATLNTSFGSKVVIPGTGVLLNNQMDDFAIAPGTTNYFGLVGGEANAIAPGRRPLSSMSPTFVLKEGRPMLCVGAAGGPTIISQTLLAILYTVDFGMPLDEALAQPRFHHQWQPDELRVEKNVKPRVLRELERRGHKLKVVESLGATQAVGWDAKKRFFVGVPDPRGEGKAGVF